jgi:hypothetical protein
MEGTVEDITLIVAKKIVTLTIVKITEVRAQEVRAQEVRAKEVRAKKVRAKKVRAKKVRAKEVRATKNTSMKVAVKAVTSIVSDSQMMATMIGAVGKSRSDTENTHKGQS